MKKILVLTLTIMMLFTLVACGSSNTPEPQATTPDESNTLAASNTSKPHVTMPGESNSPSVNNTLGPQATAPEGSNTPTERPTPSNEQSEEEKSTDTKNTNILVAYFSRVGISSFSEDVDAVSSASLIVGETELIGNTKVIADMVQEAAYGDIFHITTVKSYPEDYDETTVCGVFVYLLFTRYRKPPFKKGEFLG